MVATDLLTQCFFFATQGTHVVLGKAKGVVIGVGESTEIGKIREGLNKMEKEDSPLQKKLDHFGDQLSKVNYTARVCVRVYVWLTYRISLLCLREKCVCRFVFLFEYESVVRMLLFVCFCFVLFVRCLCNPYCFVCVLVPPLL